MELAAFRLVVSVYSPFKLEILGALKAKHSKTVSISSCKNTLSLGNRFFYLHSTQIVC